MYYKGKTYREDLNNAIHSVNDYEKLYNKSFLITGATGLLGAFIIDMLLLTNEIEDAGINIWALGRSETRLKERFKSNIDNEYLHFIVQDVNEPIELDVDMDYILNFAGDGYPGAFAKYPVETMTPAFIGSFNLLNYAKKCMNCRFLLASTGEVYGKTGGKEAIAEKDYGLIDITEIRACYPSAKRAAETLCIAFAEEYDVDVVIARLSHVYGGSTSDKDNRATAQFMNKAVNGENIVLLSEGKQMRSYTYVADAVSGIVTIMLKGQNKNAYNIANRESRVTIAQFANAVAQKCGVQCEFNIEKKNENAVIEYAVLETQKIEALGYRGQYSVAQGIENSVKILNERNSNISRHK